MKKAALFTFDERWTKADDWNIVVIGAGGNGSHFLKHFATLDMLNRYLSYQHFKCYVYDDDRIEPHNTARQAFNHSAVGEFKSVNICSRINTTYGLEYKAEPTRFDVPYGLTPVNYNIQRNTIFVLAVDDPKYRLEFYKVVRRYPIVDMGNGSNFGQVYFTFDEAMRSHPQFKSYLRSLYNQSRRKTKPVSCSHLDSVRTQGLFVNSMMGKLQPMYYLMFLCITRLPYPW
jgi:hypothetical protein